MYLVYHNNVNSKVRKLSVDIRKAALRKLDLLNAAILLHEFLEPLELTQIRFANHIKVSVQRVNEIIKGKRGISSDTAWLFSQALNTSLKLR